MTLANLTRHQVGAHLSPAHQATLDAMANESEIRTALRLGVGRMVVERLRNGGHAPVRTIERVAAGIEGIAIAGGMCEGVRMPETDGGLAE